MKGKAKVRLINGSIRYAELHWYEAHGIEKRRLRLNIFWIETYGK
jgi:hypothetical protein